jgi:hypothetical protein
VATAVAGRSLHAAICWVKAGAVVAFAAVPLALLVPLTSRGRGDTCLCSRDHGEHATRSKALPFSDRAIRRLPRAQARPEHRHVGPTGLHWPSAEAAYHAQIPREPSAAVASVNGR